MKNKLLEEARALLNKAEKISDPHQKSALCEEALERFDEILEDEKEGEIVIKINNIRKAFARSLVSQISAMNMDDDEAARFFYLNFILKFPKEVKELMEENPDFNEKIQWLATKFSYIIEDE